ncbi:MDR family oxidoreductase [Actinacidiphila sp. ITFR-21]|uniref:MDR family oxidoreductase n=1 Tax=Actinacidiphila sp. ITFR-21 TaxID=3075199 RepID=UPI00288A5C1A|nr:MDR family oxidoreductase [Streptomyces sp. ITFR-21]WNI19455.1 MDR family oxidoreductase [Streptomyces sp. ITFR-21]
MTSFPAVVATGEGPAELRELTEADLPPDPVTIEVTHSSLNYKDGLAVTNTAPIVRSFPMVCGADLAGRVVASRDPAWRPGDEVLVTGWGLSETHPGGYTRLQRVRPEWVVRRPETLSAEQAMAIGTAGLTAMLCVMALERHGLVPGAPGGVLVTGAAGGVGSLAVALLAELGHEVTAATGRPETRAHLADLGAAGFVDRAELAEGAGRPLQKERWSAGIDTVGSTTLASALSRTRYGGAVAACGLAGGSDLPTTVLPFILRGVALLGVDSVRCPAGPRAEAWRRLSTELPPDKLRSLTRVEPMSRIHALAEEILAGRVHGRVVIDTRR